MLGGMPRSRSEIASIRSRACRRPSSDPVERQRRRPGRVLHRDGRAVAARQHLEHADGGVVHVSGAGRHVDEQPLTIEGVGAFELAHRERDTLRFVFGALESDVDADHVDRVLAHDLARSFRPPAHSRRSAGPASTASRTEPRCRDCHSGRKTAAAGRTTAPPPPRVTRSFRSRVASRSACRHPIAASDTTWPSGRHSDSLPGRHAARGAGDPIGELALTGGDRGRDAGDREAHRQRLDDRELAFVGGCVVRHARAAAGRARRRWRAAAAAGTTTNCDA